MMWLPYPPALLNPNKSKGRHWGTISRARKKYRGECLLLARSQIKRDGIKLPDSPLVKLRLVFRPPPGTPPDDDNIIAAFKSGRDALAEAFGVDDKLFRTDPVMGEPVPFGRVEVSFLPLTGDDG